MISKKRKKNVNAPLIFFNNFLDLNWSYVWFLHVGKRSVFVAWSYFAGSSFIFFIYFLILPPFSYAVKIKLL